MGFYEITANGYVKDYDKKKLQKLNNDIFLGKYENVDLYFIIDDENNFYLVSDYPQSLDDFDEVLNRLSKIIKDGEIYINCIDIKKGWQYISKITKNKVKNYEIL